MCSAITLLLALSTNAAAEWIRVGENNRSVAYVDSAVRRTGDVATYWVMYDYKFIQESPRSGKKYLSEKAQYQTECQAERNRAVFFTWHSEQMGNGTVVYTGNKATKWEPTSSPGSLAKAFWSFVCSNK